MIHPEQVANFLREAEVHHHEYEANAPEHSWSDWYAGYVAARLMHAGIEKALVIADAYVNDLREAQVS